MAGVINVIDTCDGENWLTNYSFNVTAGSPFGYNIFIDGMLWNDSPILYSDPTGLNSGVLSLPGDNMTYFVTFQDVETNFCAFTESVTTGQCGASCIIDELVVKTGEDVIHEIEVRDYDFLPAEITARAGETVRFIWTGDVPHTSTSDLVSGIDSWESGLLSKGDTFDLVLQTPGDHPFYCKPHGGPGGIGQAGVISILPQCEDGQEELTICFDAKGGSTEGYRLFIDGNIVGDLQDYENSNGANSISVLLPADGLQHIITIQDDQDSICAASINYYADDCTLDCEMGGLSYELISTSHTVLVLDNEYLPVEIDVEAGDTINFVWEGLIPHTVTSDSISTNTGNAFFNSGLLQQGAQWNLILNETGEYPYYCVPHGGPGGVGMAGSISVSEPCEDEQTLAQFTFVTSKLAGTYDVILNGSEVLSNVPYTGVPQNTFVLTLPADNTELNIMVIDGNDPLCTISLIIDGIDCNDPCFDTEASYDYNIDFTTMNVTFNSTSSGDIVSWMWDFGDGNFSEEENPNHTFLDPLVYEVCLTVTDDQDCVDTICDKVRFSNEVCIAGFDYIQNDLDFIFLNTSDYEDPETEILWTFDDGSLSTLTDSVAHTFELGIYTVCIEITSDSCSATYCEQIDLSDPCLLITPNFIADVDEPNLTVNFTDLSTGEPDTWLWGFGDGTTSPEQNPSHTYDSFGDYNVCLFVQQSDESCSKSICRKISVGITGVVEIEKFKTLTIYPNPSQVTSDIFVKGFNSKDLGKGAKVAIRNSAGIAISEYTIVLEETIAIELQDLPGIYMINVTAENFSYQSLFIRL